MSLGVKRYLRLNRVSLAFPINIRHFSLGDYRDLDISVYWNALEKNAIGNVPHVFICGFYQYIDLFYVCTSSLFHDDLYVHLRTTGDKRTLGDMSLLEDSAITSARVTPTKFSTSHAYGIVCRTDSIYCTDVKIRYY